MAFDGKMATATTVEDDMLLFEVPPHIIEAGKHPINGVFRVGYIHGNHDLSMVNICLIANGTGTE